MFSAYIQMLRREFHGYNAQKLGRDAVSGITVTAVALPLALAFGVSCGADAAAGLITAILSGLIIGALSGAAFQISGPTGAMTAVLVTIIAKFQLQGVFLVSLIAGILLLIIGIFKLGKLINIIPAPVITGFTSGIAIIIALGQIDNLFGTVSQGETALARLMSYKTLGFMPNMQTLLIGMLVIAIMIIWPKKWNERVPSSLVGIIVATIVSSVLHLDVAVVGNIPRTLLPAARLDITAIDFSAIPQLLGPAVTIAALAMIESLLCGASASRMKGQPFDANCELVAQGVGNIIVPFFGGVPATAAIARTSVAIKSGCETRLTGIFHALGLLASMFLLGSVMSKLPLAALAGVLMVTAWRMNEWHSIKYIFRSGFKSAIAQFAVTMLCTVIFDLTVAIVIGVICAGVMFITNATVMEVAFSEVKNHKLRHRDDDVEETHGDAVVVYITGALFFANADSLRGKIISECDSAEVIFSMRGVSVMDFGGAHAFVEIVRTLRENGAEVLVCGLPPRVKNTLVRAGLCDVIGEESFYWSVDRALLA